MLVSAVQQSELAMHECVLSHFSHVQLFAVLRTVACQAPLSMGFSGHKYWSGLPCSSLGDLPNPEIELISLVSPALAGGFFTTSTSVEALNLPHDTAMPLLGIYPEKSEVAQSCPTLCNPMDCSLPRFSVHEIFQANLEMGCHFLLQGIFPTQGSNLGLPHCRQTLYRLSHQGSHTLRKS